VHRRWFFLAAGRFFDRVRLSTHLPAASAIPSIPSVLGAWALHKSTTVAVSCPARHCLARPCGASHRMHTTPALSVPLLLSPPAPATGRTGWSRGLTCEAHQLCRCASHAQHHGTQGAESLRRHLPATIERLPLQALPGATLKWFTTLVQSKQCRAPVPRHQSLLSGKDWVTDRCPQRRRGGGVDHHQLHVRG
jgi:hypothetical protein